VTAHDSSQGSGGLTAEQRERLAALRSAETLVDLQRLTGADSEHDAYLRAKAEWAFLHERALGEQTAGDGQPASADGHSTTADGLPANADGRLTNADGLPGDCVVIDGQEFHVHGITHADTDAERSFLRRHVRRILDSGGSVYCEQGIRPMYFEDMDEVCEIDDYRWAMHHCRQRDIDSHIEDEIERTFDEHDRADLQSVAGRFREMTFSLIDAGGEVYGDRFASALGDVASDFLMTHEELATGQDFASFRRSRDAAENPEALAGLQQYYRRTFLPQPLEREWLRRHDPELELFTHARNERIAAYVLVHGTDSQPVHVITGAAHQPGVIYYLTAYRDGEWEVGTLETVP